MPTTTTKPPIAELENPADSHQENRNSLPSLSTILEEQDNHHLLRHKQCLKGSDTKDQGPVLQKRRFPLANTKRAHALDASRNSIGETADNARQGIRSRFPA